MFPGAQRREKWGVTASGYMVYFWNDNTVPKLDSNESDTTTELYNLNERILEYVYYFSVKLLLKKLSPAAK